MPAEKVLFVCIGNAGRSQMAQAFAERAGIEARSAGSHAETHLHPEVVEAMSELGVDLSGRIPHQLTDEDVEWADLVVTMGCGDACPVLPGKRYLDWNLQDPAGMPIDVVRQIRDRIAGLVAELD
ncbi:MAG TPA: arsenate reductase ArsC [Gaiellaceae bacterium]|nr:arsenate reductase ArsC [Gaiellaceae bacterium]